ncbi:head completion/stabilization protein [Halomonas koreensis]|uniref:Head completion/stabilization protein n=1 Tax=Halomonas koreensis TaxID=245385 RepID=A0ABU1G595_9GAMM|nr:head completion/stabilization protein [Halomonas koreensis]MDR5868086.1 head completion/stabilization protein [Halomonas koreensis]
MSSFVSAGTAATTTAEPIANNGFWPDLEPADFRERHRLDGTVTDGRLVEALEAAMAHINRVLRHWQAAQVVAGYPTIDDIPVPIWQAPGVYRALYLRAVMSMAHAGLAERYADYDATNSARERGLELEDPAEAYRRDAHWAVAEIEGRPHTTVELI